MPRLVGLRHCMLPGSEKDQCFLFFCLSVTLLNDKVCECHFVINALEFGNDLSITGYGNVCRCATCSTLSAGLSHPRMTKLKTAKLFFLVRFSGATEYTKLDKIWRVSVDRGSTQACQIWRGSV